MDEPSFQNLILSTFDFFSSFPCPLYVLVATNSPSLCPTMSSVTYTGTCFLPSCTAIVCPTMLGKIVENDRDHVLITDFSPLFVHGVNLLSRLASANGPFLIERAIGSNLLKYYLIALPSLLLTIILLEALFFFLVLRPSAGLPQGVHGPRTSDSSLAFTTTVRMVIRVHNRTTNSRSDTHVTVSVLLYQC